MIIPCSIDAIEYFWKVLEYTSNIIFYAIPCTLWLVESTVYCKKKMTMPKTTTTRKLIFMMHNIVVVASFYSHILIFWKIHKWTPCKIDYLNRMTINDCHHHILKDRISFFVLQLLRGFPTTTNIICLLFSKISNI